jgi:predicted dehydrogenase
MFSGGAEDRVMATIEFENGAVGHISNSWTTRAPWQFQFMILGTEGSIYTPVNPSATSIEQHEAPAVVSCFRHDMTGAGSSGGVSQPFVPIDLPEGLFSNNPYVNEIAHFADCCRSGQDPISSGRDNLDTMKIVFGIYEASRRGQIVDLTEL